MREWPDPLITIVSIVLAIMVLTLFFKAINWVERKASKNPMRVAFKGILDEKTPATVFLGGEKVENVLLKGFTDTTSFKNGLPHQFNNMVILEHADGRRTIIPAKSIQRIVVEAKRG